MQVYRENRKFIKSWLLHLLTIICIHSANFKIGEQAHSSLHDHKQLTSLGTLSNGMLDADVLNQNEIPFEQTSIEVENDSLGAPCCAC